MKNISAKLFTWVPFILFILGISCAKKSKPVRDINDSVTGNEVNLMSYNKWQNLEFCKRRSFDTWIVDSFRSKMYTDGSVHPDSIHCSSEGIVEPPKFDSVIFDNNELHIYSKKYDTPAHTVRYGIQCRDSWHYIGTPEEYRILGTMEDTLLEVKFAGPWCFLFKTAFQTNYRWELDYYFSMQTDKLSIK